MQHRGRDVITHARLRIATVAAIAAYANRALLSHHVSVSYS